MLPVSAGDLPEYLELGLTVYNMVLSKRRRRVEDFYGHMTAHTEMAADALMEVMENEDLFSEIFERGAEAAMKTASELKRRLLGRAVAAALDGAGYAKPEAYQLLVRTIDAIEPAHIHMLIVLACPEPGTGELAYSAAEGWVTDADILDRWPEAVETARPLLAVLEREGLIDERTMASSKRAYAPTHHGRFLLSQLAEEDLEGSDLGVALLRVWFELSPAPSIVIRNVGPGSASGITLTAKGSQGEGESVLLDQLPEFELGPLEDHSVLTEIPGPGRDLPYLVEVTWQDSQGQKRHQRNVATRDPESGYPAPGPG